MVDKFFECLSSRTIKQKPVRTTGGVRLLMNLSNPKPGQFCWHPVLADPARPLRRAPRPDPPGVCSGFRFYSFISNLTPPVVRTGFCLIVLLDRHSNNLSTVFPEHALHEKGSQIQKGVGPLVSSQEERALLVSLINRLPRKQKSLVHFKASKKRRFNISPEARTNKILCKPKEQKNQRLSRA